MKKLVVLFLFSIAGFQSVDSQAQNYSSAGCRAYTTCPNGGTIWCQTYGYSYAGMASGSRCYWNVVPYYSVECGGYTQSKDWFGNTVWAWNKFRYTCY